MMISVEDTSDGYQVYVLRLWRVRCQGQWEWRASIESPGIGKRLLFASLEQLSVYLRERCKWQPPDPATLPGA